MVLPGGRSDVAVTWKGVPWLGLYRTDVRIANAAAPDDPIARSSGWFIALPPLWVLALAALVVIAAVARRVLRRAGDDRDEPAADDGVDHDLDLLD